MGTAQEKLDASRAFVAAEQAAKKMRADAMAHDAALAVAVADAESARNRVAEAKEAAEQAEREAAEERAAAEAARVEGDPILRGIRDHRLVLGMTLAEAQKAMGTGVRVEETAAGVVYRWQFGSMYYAASGSPVFTTGEPFYACFAAGKIVEIRGRQYWVPPANSSPRAHRH